MLRYGGNHSLYPKRENIKNQDFQQHQGVFNESDYCNRFVFAKYSRYLMKVSLIAWLNIQN